MAKGPDLWTARREHAAWDTVSALREEVRRERARVQRLLPVHESWKALADELDSAAQQLDLPQAKYAQVVRALRERYAELVSENAELKRRLAEQRGPSQSSPAVIQVLPASAVSEGARGSAQIALQREELAQRSSATLSGSVRWFAERLEQRLQRLQAETGRAAPARDRLLERMEDQLEELEQASFQEAAESAIEIALCALLIARRGD